MLSRWASPFEVFDHHHPLLAYVIREVRGGRTPEGLVRYTWKVAAVLSALMFGGALLAPVVFLSPYNTDDHFLQVWLVYSLAAVSASIFLFPLVDLVTLFYGAVGIRTEVKHDVHFDLVRASTLEAHAYVQSRLALAQVRAWRVFIIMWLMRLFACVILALTALAALLFSIASGNLTLTDILSPEMVYMAFFVTAGSIIFLILMLWEPLWRFRMMTALAATLAARIRGGVTMWLTLGGATMLVVFVQGMFAIFIVWMGAIMTSFVSDLWSVNVSDSGAFREMLSLAAGFIPWMALPPGVWALQTSVTRWWEGAAVAAIFAPTREDA